MATLESRILVTWETRWRHQISGGPSRARAERLSEILGPNFELAEISTDDVQILVLELEERGHSPATINRYLASLSAVLSDARADGLTVGACRILRQREQPGRTRWLSNDEVCELAHAMRPIRGEWAELIWFLAQTGLRPSEALRLDWKDCEAGCVHIWQTKTGKPRTVPLTAIASLALDEVRGGQGPWYGACIRSIQRAFLKARRETSMRWDHAVTLYVLRHSAATSLVQAGVHIRTVQEWLGHSSIRTTQRYAHVSDSLLESARDALESNAARSRKEDTA